MKTIALFLHDPKCSVQSGNGILKALEGTYNFKIFGKNELEDCFFDDVDMIIIPGGIGDSDNYDTLMKHSSSKIKEFVQNGGKYLGICMGAYWASKEYLNILDSIWTEQYIKRPNSKTRRPHAKAMSIWWKNKPNHMFFYDGCAIVGDLHKCKVIAKYGENQDAMAVIQDNIGLIGCHPEAEKFWYDSYSWMKSKWHGEQHDLLLKFVNELMEKK